MKRLYMVIGFAVPLAVGGAVWRGFGVDGAIAAVITGTAHQQLDYSAAA